jgi:ABC-type Fe3+-hydroxamate transport system substrate-binding protein
MRRLVLPILALTMVLAACADSSSPTTSASSSTTSAEASTTTPSAQTTTTETGPTTTAGVTTTSSAADVPLIKVEDGVKTEGLDTISVRVGETVRFEVEADVADEIHVHGYDLLFETIPDEEVLVEFVADATGIFEVELEGLGLSIVDIEVTP